MSTAGAAASPDARPRGLWRVVTILLLFQIAIQIDFLTYATDSVRVSQALGVPIASIGLLTSIPAIMNIALILPCGWLADRTGMRPLILGAAAALVVGATLRLVLTSYHGLLLAQVVLALAGPLVAGAIAPFLRRWVGPRDYVWANMLPHAALLGGIMLAFLLIPRVYAAFDFSAGLRLISGLVLAFAVVALLAMPTDPPEPALQPRASLFGGFGFIGKPLYVYLAILFICGNVFFNGLVVWLGAMLGSTGVSAADAGLVGAAIILGGVTGTLALPPLIARTGRPKLVMVLLGLPVGLAVLSLTWPGSLVRHGAAAFLVGASMSSGLPIYMSWLARAFRASMGKVIAVNQVAQSGGAAIGAAVLPYFVMGQSWTPAAWFLNAVLVLSGVALLLVPVPSMEAE